jgi:hypothetical protein
MQNKEASIEHLEDQWRSLHEASSIRFRPLIEFAMSLDEENRNAGLTAIAQHFISTLSLHYLDIMSIFQQKAEQEEIDLEEREGTLHDILEASFPLMLGLNSNISIQSLNDLLTLSNITIGLYRLSHVDSAESAQRWMYKLPKLYHSQLAQEHLIINAKDTTF